MPWAIQALVIDGIYPGRMAGFWQGSDIKALAAAGESMVIAAPAVAAPESCRKLRLFILFDWIIVGAECCARQREIPLPRGV